MKKEKTATSELLFGFTLKERVTSYLESDVSVAALMLTSLYGSYRLPSTQKTKTKVLKKSFVNNSTPLKVREPKKEPLTLRPKSYGFCKFPLRGSLRKGSALELYNITLKLPLLLNSSFSFSTFLNSSKFFFLRNLSYQERFKKGNSEHPLLD